MCSLTWTLALFFIIINNTFLNIFFIIIIITTTWDVQGPVGVNVSGTDGTPGWSALH